MNSPPGSWLQDKYPSRAGSQDENKYPSRAGVQNDNKYPSRAGSQNKNEYPSQRAYQGGRMREAESSGNDSQCTNQGNKMATEDKAKGKERITNNGWQVVEAKGRKRLPATPATHVESPKRGMQTGTTRPTTPTDRGPPEGHQVPAGESPLDEALDIKNPGEFSPRSSKGPPAGHQDPAGRGPSKAARQAGLPHRRGSAPLPGELESDSGYETDAPPPHEGTHSPARTGAATAKCQWVQGRGTWTPEAQQGRGGRPWAWPAAAKQEPNPSHWTTQGKRNRGRAWQYPSWKTNVPSQQWKEGGASEWNDRRRNEINTSPWQGQRGGGSMEGK